MITFGIDSCNTYNLKKPTPEWAKSERYEYCEQELHGRASGNSGTKKLSLLQAFLSNLF